MISKHGEIIKVNIIENSDGNINIYYNEDFIVCHSLSDKKNNYKIGHIHEILKLDDCKHLSHSEVDEFIKENITMMDILFGE